VADGLAAEGFPARMAMDRLGQHSIRVDLGAGWSASITTAAGDLSTYDPSKDPLQMNLDGPGLPGEGYVVTWWPSTEDLRRLPRAAAPLLRRLSIVAPTPRERVPDTLDASTAEVILRDLLGDARDTASVWSAFCLFARREAAGLRPEEDEDALLFECGDASGGPFMSLVRQFDGSAVGGDPMQQLVCEICFAPDPALAEAFGAHLPCWGRAGREAGGWIAVVEATPAFRAGLGGTVTDVAVVQTLV
jgi:hypothetical protein